MRNISIIILIVSFLTISCKNEVSIDSLVDYKGIKYYKEKPFSGIGIRKLPDGIIITKISFEDGKVNGDYEEFYNDGSIAKKVFYKNGHAEGLAEAYYDNGKLGVKVFYNKEGYAEGCERYYKSGALQGKSNSVTGLFANNDISYKEFIGPPGQFETYFENGKLKTKGNYDGYHIIGPYVSYYPNGNLRTKSETYFNAKFENINKEKSYSKTYYSNGKLRYHATFIKDKKYVKTYYEDGSLAYEGFAGGKLTEDNY